MNVLVTAGPTREAIDPVRFISNRSSGKMGYAVAVAAAGRGHAVRLVSGPVCLAPPGGVAVERVTTAAEMLGAVRKHLGWCDCLIMAAAVADWRPGVVSASKLKKSAGAPVIELEPTQDILGSVAAAKGSRIFVGFAAESSDPVAEARRKLRQKGLDLIVANDISRKDAGFEVDTNRVVLIGADGSATELPLMSKPQVAEKILDAVAEIDARQARA